MRRAFTLSLLLLAALRATAAEEIYTAECEIVRGRLIVPVMIENTGPYPFLVDAGLRQPVLTPEAVEYFGIATGSLPEYPGVEVVEFEAFAPATLPAQPVTAIVSTVADLSNRLAYRVAGLLPLHQPGFEIMLELHAGKITWRALADAALDKDTSRAVPLRIAENGQPQVQALLNGEFLAPVQIDLNFGETLVLPPELVAEVAATDTPRLRTRLDGGGAAEQLRLQEIKIGQATLRNPVCTIGRAGQPARIGLGMLRHFLTTFNLEYGRLEMTTEAADDPEDPPLAGFGLALSRQNDDNYWGLHIAEDSPAAEAGLLPGDLLVGIAGQSLEAVGYEGVMRLLKADAGDGISVRVRRGTDLRTLELVARTLL